jgi:hypothetical protein
MVQSINAINNYTVCCQIQTEKLNMNWENISKETGAHTLEFGLNCSNTTWNEKHIFLEASLGMIYVCSGSSLFSFHHHHNPYNNPSDIYPQSQRRIAGICLKDSYVYITQQDAPHKDKNHNPF